MAILPEISVFKNKQLDTPFKLHFQIRKTYTAFVNMLTREIPDTTPTLAVHVVEFIRNTTVLSDDKIAHRLQMIPIWSEYVDQFFTTEECTCKDYGCEKCEITFKYEGTNTTNDPLNVSYNDLQSSNSKVFPFTMHPYFHNLSPKHMTDTTKDFSSLVVLAKNQSLSFVCKVKKGIGQRHAKWNPVIISFHRPIPIIEFNKNLLSLLSPEEKQRFVKSCPTKVFNFDSKKDQVQIGLEKSTPILQIEDLSQCTYCMDCVEEAGEILVGLHEKKKITELKENFVSIKPNYTEFNYCIESVGNLTSLQILLSSLKIMKHKLLQLQKWNSEFIK